MLSDLHARWHRLTAPFVPDEAHREAEPSGTSTTNPASHLCL